MTYLVPDLPESFSKLPLKSISPLTSAVRCRRIEVTDLDGVVTLLTTGFRKRPREFWMRALARLSEHSTPPELPKYGYLLEVQGTPVGVILQIYYSILVDGQIQIRCSMSSWYVKPAFRGYAAMLNAQA